MDETLEALPTWLAQAGLCGRSEVEIITTFCDRLLAAGLPVARAIALIDTLHPVHEGHVFRWQRDGEAESISAYGRAGSSSGYDPELWSRSIFKHLFDTGGSFIDVIVDEESEARFSQLGDLREAGMTHHACLASHFGEAGSLGEMDCFFAGFTTDRPEGFSKADLETLRSLMPHLALAVKSVSLRGVAATLVDTYLGRDAGRRVLGGRIERGVADRIEAVLWFSDLRGFTRISDTAPDAIIPLLNDYADVVVSAIEERGGDVLKFIGDGILAIFDSKACEEACDAALMAAKVAHKGIAKVNERRRAQGLPVTELYLGLHLGEVFYGNIGSLERLDFTVVGPAVNEVSRISTLCRSVDQPLLISSAFAENLGRGRERLASVGRYALRGVARPQELYTIDPEALRPKPAAPAPAEPRPSEVPA